MKLKRTLVSLAAVAALTGSLTACGGSDDGDDGDKGGDSSKAASEDEFCSAYQDASFVGVSDKVDTSDKEKLLEALQDGADKLQDVGTPDGIGEEERKGFEVYVDTINRATVDDLENGGMETSTEDNEAALAFIDYASTTCDLPGLGEESSPSESPS